MVLCIIKSEILVLNTIGYFVMSILEKSDNVSCTRGLYHHQLIIRLIYFFVLFLLLNYRVKLHLKIKTNKIWIKLIYFSFIFLHSFRFIHTLYVIKNQIRVAKYTDYDPNAVSPLLSIFIAIFINLIVSFLIFIWFECWFPILILFF